MKTGRYLFFCVVALALAGATAALLGGSVQEQAAAAPSSSPWNHQGHAHGVRIDGGAHEHDEGLALRPSDVESVEAPASAGCEADAPVRRYDLTALAVDITLNRYGDHDPEGLAYVLDSEVSRVQESARSGVGAVSIGLQGDALQPLVMRAVPGECVRITLTNQLDDAGQRPHPCLDPGDRRDARGGHRGQPGLAGRARREGGLRVAAAG